MTDALTPNLEDLEPLDEDEVDDACFRAADRLWQSVGHLFDRYEEEQGTSYATIARRIRRTRSQVQRWLSAPHNMTLKSAGLLAEGLDADLVISVQPRGPAHSGANYAHPCVREAQQLLVQYKGPPATYKNLEDQTLKAMSSNTETSTKSSPVKMTFVHVRS